MADYPGRANAWNVLLLHIGIHPIAAHNLNFLYISCAKGTSYQFTKRIDQIRKPNG
jgi:hypothetical protein